MRGFPDSVENAVYLDQVDSTHALALRLMEQMEEQGLPLRSTVIIAGRQTLGRGRCDRNWESPPGGLYLNWLRSGVPGHSISRLPMLAAAAAHRAISERGVRGAGIKWPNDIVVKTKKLAGILIHARDAENGWVTVGLGVNLEKVPGASGTTMANTTAMAELVRPAPFEQWSLEITSAFLTSLTRFLDDPEPGIEQWRRGLIHRPGESLSVRLNDGKSISGTYRGLTTEGFLRLEVNGSERVITSGDVVEAG